ncbi:30S ribosomal protein S8 [bacterium]|nr:30S ribosomal protein S8 [bacterium]
MLTDTLADTLTRIRNGQRAGHQSVRVRSSRMIKAFLQVLQEEGFIAGYRTEKDESGKFDEVEVALRYLADGAPAILDMQRASKPGRRWYTKGTDVPQVEHGLGLAVISTSRGVMADRKARREKIGGEILAFVR